MIRILLNVTGGSILQELQFVHSIEWESPEQIREIQRQRLIALLRHAWEHTEYYKGVLTECGVVYNGMVNLDRFEEIPFLTKDILREEGMRLKAKALPGGRKPFLNRTGGSTGQPCEFWQDNYYDAVNIADKLYHFRIFGKELGAREMKIWGSNRDLIRDTSTWAAKAKNFLYNRKIENCSSLSESRILSIIRTVNRFQPETIWGYIDGLYTIADYINRHGISLHIPAAVFCGGGTFYPHMAEAIETAFHCPAVNYYGSREMGAIACQCTEETGLHITSHSHLVEAVDHNDTAVLEAEGDLVVTSLTNYAMPFIRYRIGDRGKLAACTCPCGRGFPLLESVSGRSMESFVRPDGGFVSPIYLITMIGVSLYSGLVRKFQLVQDDYSHVTLKMVIDTEVNREKLWRHLDDIANKLRSLMGADCAVAHEFVDDIPPTKSGKYLYTVCKVQEQPISSQLTQQLGAYKTPKSSLDV